MDKEIDIREDHITFLLRGERPEGMDLDQFKLKRKAIQQFLRGIKRGRVIYETNGKPYTKEK